MSDNQEALRKRIDFLEEAYEYFLSYAARGLTGEEGSSSELRKYLADAVKVTGELKDLFVGATDDFGPDDPGAFEEFIKVLEHDAVATRRALRLVNAQPTVSSQLVDNLNASIHFRALLTDLFLIDEIFHPRHIRKAKQAAAKAAEAAAQD